MGGYTLCHGGYQIPLAGGIGAFILEDIEGRPSLDLSGNVRHVAMYSFGGR